MELKHDKGLWAGLNGASSFADGTEPYFAEMKLTVGSYAHAVLVLDDGTEAPYRRVRTLTVNLSTDDMDILVFSKELPGLDRAQARSFAERHLTEDTTAEELELLGFRREEY